MSGAPGGFALDSRWVRRSFERAAGTYDAAALPHAQVREELLSRLELMAIAPGVVMDAGAGTGHASRALKRRYPKALVIAQDFSVKMLEAADGRRGWLRRFSSVCTAAEGLCFKDGAVDLIFSNLMLQWCDPDAVLAEFQRVLKPRGLLCFSTFGPDTLRELRSAWAAVDDGPHVNTFIDMHDLGDALVRAGFAAPVLDVDRITVRYESVDGLLADLKATGERNAGALRSRGLTSPRRFAAMRAAYERFRHEGLLPATYEIVFAHAWAPQTRRTTHDVSTVSLAEIQRQLKNLRPA